MQTDLQAILRPEIMVQYRDKPPSEILAAPLKTLRFLTEDQLTELRGHSIDTVGDLVALKDWGAGLRIDSSWLGSLTRCLAHPEYDPGPNQAWEQLFRRAPLDYYVNYVNYSQHPFHTRFGPVFYRGRLDGTARVLVIGQDPSTDEILAHRVFVGAAGQIAQSFLAKLGLTRSYVMFNTFLFGVQSGSITTQMVNNATIKAYRNELLDYAAATSQLTAILAFGQHAYTSATNWPGRGTLPIVHLTHPTAPSGVAANWNSKLATAHNLIEDDADGQVDLAPFSTSKPLPSKDVPRLDLPFGVPFWHGTGGHTLSKRGTACGALYETNITWTAPDMEA